MRVCDKITNYIVAEQLESQSTTSDIPSKKIKHLGVVSISLNLQSICSSLSLHQVALSARSQRWSCHLKADFFLTISD